MGGLPNSFATRETLIDFSTNKLLKIDYLGEQDNPRRENQMEVKDIGVENNPVEPALRSIYQDVVTHGGLNQPVIEAV